MKTLHYLLIFAVAGGLASCRNKENKETSQVSQADTTVLYQPVVRLPPPDEKASNVKYSKVIGWPENQTPKAAEGFTVTKFASVLKSPRNIYVAPNGDIFISLANTETKGLKKVKDAVTGRDESQHTSKSFNQIYLFRDADGDGTPEVQTPYLTGLNQPFGMLVIGNMFYVANTDGVWQYPYNEKDTKITSKGTKIVDLPAGGYNNHWTRNLIANANGNRIYISVGSASNAAEYGLEEEVLRANILEINTDGSNRRIFASGLRNPVGMDWAPGTNELWTVVNERDKLGDDLVPDYLTSVKDGGFYGWPYSYFGQNLDPRIKEKDQKPALVKRALVPDFALDSHSSSMGLIFGDHPRLPSKYRGGAFVTQHGSWNRAEFTGYRVIFIPFKHGKPSGPAEDFLTGFIADAEKGEVYGRPVAMAITKDGSLLVTDDASDVIWMVRGE
jgi:glucose/arabinose dehydrogenase